MIKNNLLKISGLDAKRFLQGQLTCNLDDITSQNSKLSAHCNAQGRVISLFSIFLYQNDYYLLMPDDLIPIALAALKKYAIFFKVSLEVVTINEAFESSNIFDWTNNVAAGIPRIYSETSGKFLPHELDLHKLNAISFDKGCYTGQEIIARMHYRGKLKNHLYKANLACSFLPNPGLTIYYQAGHDIKIGGTIVDRAPQITDNQIHPSCLVLLICDEMNAKNNHLFIEQNGRTYINFFEQVKESNG